MGGEEEAREGADVEKDSRQGSDIQVGGEGRGRADESDGEETGFVGSINGSAEKLQTERPKISVLQNANLKLYLQDIHIKKRTLITGT